MGEQKPRNWSEIVRDRKRHQHGPIVALGISALLLFVSWWTRRHQMPAISVLAFLAALGAGVWVKIRTRIAQRDRAFLDQAVIEMEALDAGPEAQREARAEYRAQAGPPPTKVEAWLVAGTVVSFGALGVFLVVMGIVQLRFSVGFGVLLVALGAAHLVGCALGARAWLVRRRRFAARHEALADWASIHSGRVSRSFAALDAWLSAHWPAHIVASVSNRSGVELVELTAGGHPALVIVAPESDPMQAVRSWSRPHVRLLLAASARPLEPSPTLAALREAGFEVAASEAGLSAEASREMVEHLRRHPEDVAPLAHALDLLARLANEVRAVGPWR